MIRLPGQSNPFRGPTSRASLVQGPDPAFAGGRSRGDCSPRGLLPRPRGSSTFCRERVTETAGGAALSGARIAHPLRAHPARPACARHAAGDLAFARPSGRTASHVPPRRGARSAEPKVLSIVGLSPGDVRTCSANRTRPQGSPARWAVIHMLFPTCGNLAGASSTPAAGARFDEAFSWQRARTRVSCPDPKVWTGERDRSAPDDFCVQDDPRLG